MKKTNSKSNKKLIIIITITLVLCIVLAILTVISEKQKIEKENELKNKFSFDGVVTVDDLKTVEQIIQFSESEYISETQSAISDYDTDIKVYFKYNLYENGISKEKYFMAIINQIGYLKRFSKNYRILDDEKNIEICVKCDGEKIIEILINNESDYYIKNDNKDFIEKSNDKNISEIRVKSEELKTLIDNSWKYNEDYFGTRESDFLNYYCFFDEGIDVKKVQSNVFNIVFNKKYDQTVINSIKPGSNLDKVKEQLGEPTYESTGIIGYKNEDIFVFFSEENETISIYPNIENNNSDFENLVEKFINNEINLKEFMNELTYLWPDYSEYKYSNNYVKIEYPVKGIKIEYGNENGDDGIFLYDNYTFTDNSMEWLKDGKIKTASEKNLFLENEKEKISTLKNININANMMYEFSEYPHIVSKYFKFAYNYDEKLNINSIYIISKDENYPNRELKVKPTNALILNDKYLLYGIAQEGIYAYNFLTNEKNLIFEGEENFELKYFEDNSLFYDDQYILLEMEE